MTPFARALFLGLSLVFVASCGASKDTAEVSVEEFLDLKRSGRVREVWMKDADLVAEMHQDFDRDGMKFPKVHCVVPPAYLQIPEGTKVLMAGIAPDRFHIEAAKK